MPDSTKLDDLKQLLSELEPIETISHLAFGAVVFSPDDINKDLATEYGALEMVTGFYAASPVNRNARRPSVEDIEQVKAKGSEIINSYFVEALQKQKSQLTDMNERDIAVKTQLYYLYVRHEGYPNQLWNAAEREFSLHDSFLKSRLGFDIKTVIGIFKYIYNAIEKKTTAHIREFVSIMSGPMQIWHDWKDGKIDDNEMLDKTKAYRERGQLHRDLESHGERLKDALTLSTKELKEKFGNEVTEKFLSRFGTRFGEINQHYKEPLDFNEIYSKPILILEDEKIFAPVVPLLADVPIKTLHYNLITDSGYEPTYSKLRSDYYESQATQYLSRIFGANNVYLGLRYGRNEEFETDVLVHFHDRILIFECKSKTLTLPARQGKYDTILNDFKQAIQSSYDQARRTRDYMNTSQVSRFQDRKGRTIEIHKDQISRIYMCCLTTDSFSGLGADLTNILQKEQDDDFPWVISMMDLELVSEYLTNPYYFLHFLGRRIRYHGKVFSPDEMDYVGCYLSTGLFFEEEVKKYTMTSIIGFTEQFDFDQLRKMGKDVTAKVGSSWSNPAFSNLIGTIACYGGLRHVSIIETLLDLNSGARDQLINAIDATIDRTLTDKKMHDFTLVFENFGISFVSKFGRDDLQDTNSGMAILKKYKHRKDKWVGLGRDVSDKDYLVNEFVCVEKKWEHDSKLEPLANQMKGTEL